MSVGIAKALSATRSVVFAAALGACASAETVRPPESPVVFPSEAVPFARPRNLKQTILFRPSEGSKPFPAIVILPTCGGMGSHIYDWAERLTGAGYVTLLVESNTARGFLNNCSNPPQIKYDQQVVDAGAALEHLRRLPIVDRNRLGVMGLSFGAGVGLRMASESYQRVLPYGAGGLRAVASFYPWCAQSGRGFDSRDIFTEGLPSDIVTPTIMFLGAIDDESLPSPCTERADRMKAEGKPIGYKLYPDTTHAFDSPENGLAGRKVRGQFFYRYNPAATEDAWRELAAFFGRNLKAP
ncbi:MAG: dienelactone hydrolase family protein [Betaproteobacteria bacterium]|nr:dienelactone hydrolase family protein [Betaproteobacteria bacterium]